MTLKEADGKLTGTLTSPDGEKLPLQELKLAGGDLTCKVSYMDGSYQIRMKVSGDTMEGQWSGGADSGALKAVRKR